jgi:hypothetical protein
VYYDDEDEPHECETVVFESRTVTSFDVDFNITDDFVKDGSTFVFLKISRKYYYAFDGDISYLYYELEDNTEATEEWIQVDVIDGEVFTLDIMGYLPPPEYKTPSAELKNGATECEMIVEATMFYQIDNRAKDYYEVFGELPPST